MPIKKKKNVLSYYAINNTIDGQPMLDMTNLLRFYPVFTFHDSIKTLTVRVYRGSEVFKMKATKMSNGDYWEVLLPEFELGQAIQRYEVETEMGLLSSYKDLIENEKLKTKSFFDSIDLKKKIFDSIQDSISKNIININKCYTEFRIIQSSNSNVLKKDVDSFKKFINESLINLKNEYLHSLLHTDQTVVQQLFKQTKIDSSNCSKDSLYIWIINILKKDSLDYSNSLSKNFENYQSLNHLINLIENWNNKFKLKMDSVKIVSTILKVNTKQLDNLNIDYHNIANELEDLFNNQIKLSIGIQDSLKKQLKRELTDPKLSGQGVQAGDIIFSPDYKTAKVLYRNYSNENRRLPALDPAEKLSIFRIRYVPFPVVEGKLVGPAEKDVPIVFEAGITFGNVTMSSNEILKPAFAMERFGVAFAFTPQLFNADAKIKALALTYDFNAYASLGLGANFGTLSKNVASPYVSFGINFKAFQLFLRGVKKVVAQ